LAAALVGSLILSGTPELRAQDSLQDGFDRLRHSAGNKRMIKCNECPNYYYMASPSEEAVVLQGLGKHMKVCHPKTAGGTSGGSGSDALNRLAAEAFARGYYKEGFQAMGASVLTQVAQGFFADLFSSSGPSAAELEAERRRIEEERIRREEELRIQRMNMARAMREEWNQREREMESRLRGVFDTPVPRKGTDFFGIPGNPDGALIEEELRTDDSLIPPMDYDGTGSGHPTFGELFEASRRGLIVPEAEGLPLGGLDEEVRPEEDLRDALIDYRSQGNFSTRDVRIIHRISAPPLPAVGAVNRPGSLGCRCPGNACRGTRECSVRLMTGDCPCPPHCLLAPVYVCCTGSHMDWTEHRQRCNEHCRCGHRPGDKLGCSVSCRTCPALHGRSLIIEVGDLGNVPRPAGCTCRGNRCVRTAPCPTHLTTGDCAGCPPRCAGALFAPCGCGNTHMDFTENRQRCDLHCRCGHTPGSREACSVSCRNCPALH
jgi:hypothetical protein